MAPKDAKLVIFKILDFFDYKRKIVNGSRKINLKQPEETCAKKLTSQHFIQRF